MPNGACLHDCFVRNFYNALSEPSFHSLGRFTSLGEEAGQHVMHLNQAKLAAWVL